MKVSLYWNIAKILYASGLRNLLLKAIADPGEEWDDEVLRVLDVLFDYKEKG